LTPRGARGDRGTGRIGGTGGTVFLESTFLAFLVVFLQTLAWIDARNLPKFFLTPRGPGGQGEQGGQGGQFP